MGPFVAAGLGFDTADQAIITGAFKGQAPAHQGRDDHIVAFKSRHAASHRSGLDGGIPQLGRCILVDAQRQGRIMQQQTAGCLKHHVGNGVGGVLAVFGHAAQGHELAASIARVRHGRPKGYDLIHLGHFQEEKVHQLLSELRSGAASGHIGLVEITQVLIHTAVADTMQLAVQGHTELV